MTSKPAAATSSTPAEPGVKGARAAAAALLALSWLVTPLPASAKQQFECTVLFAPQPDHPAYPSGRLSVRAADAADAACVASGEVSGCRATCRPAAPAAPAAVSTDLACAPQANDPPGQRCLAYVCVPKDRGWGSGAEYRVTARTASELAAVRRRPGDSADRRYDCMGEPDYESLRKTKGWPVPGSGGFSR